MRILIVGGGMAGMTLAGELRHYPVEKVAEDVLKSNTTPF